MAGRRLRNALDAPIAIYEVHLGSWRRPEGGGGFLLHRQEIGVILDWAPAHSPGTSTGWRTSMAHPYEHEDPRLREHPNWSTRVFSYGRNEVANFLIGSALFWLERYRLDGLRLDAVASMLCLDDSRRPGESVPNVHGGNENLETIAFLKRLNETICRYHPDVMTIAEGSTARPMVSRPTYLGGAWARIQVETGLDA